MNLLSNTIAAAPDCWMQDRLLDVTGHSNDADNPTELADWTSDGTVAYSAWAKLVVPVTTRVRIVTASSTIADTVLFLYDSPPSSGSSAIEINDDADSDKWGGWSSIDRELAAGTYWVAAIPFLGSGDIDLADGKYLYLSVRPLDGVSIRIKGQDVTDNFEIKTAQFTSQANGAAGSARLRFRDKTRTASFIPGSILTCDVHGDRQWNGYIRTIRRGFYTEGFEALNTVPRYLELVGADVNVLFPSRQTHSKVAPLGRTEFTAFPPGSADDAILLAYLRDFFDIEDDLITTWGITNVGSPSRDSSLQGLAGESMGSFFSLVSRNLGSVYYIDPERVVRYVDTETVTAPFDVSDQPLGTEEGVRSLEILPDGAKMLNDALVWGVGQGADHAVFSRVTDGASVAEYKLWQFGLYTPQMFRQATVDRVAEFLCEWLSGSSPWWQGSDAGGSVYDLSLWPLLQPGGQHHQPGVRLD